MQTLSILRISDPPKKNNKHHNKIHQCCQIDGMMFFICVSFGCDWICLWLGRSKNEPNKKTFSHFLTLCPPDFGQKVIRKFRKHQLHDMAIYITHLCTKFGVDSTEKQPKQPKTVFARLQLLTDATTFSDKFPLVSRHNQAKFSQYLKSDFQIYNPQNIVNYFIIQASTNNLFEKNCIFNFFLQLFLPNRKKLTRDTIKKPIKLPIRKANSQFLKFFIHMVNVLQDYVLVTVDHY